MEKKSLGETRLSRENQRKKVIINQDLDFLKIYLHWFDNYVHLADLKKWWSSLNISLELISFNSDAFVFHSEAFLFISY